MTVHPQAEQPGTRERILDAALDLFAREGFAGASMRQLANAVGLTQSSLYNHFSSKEAIYHALIDAHGPAHSAERLKGPGYLALRGDPAAFCKHYAAELLTQWSDPREQKFQELITAERNRLPSGRDHYYATLFNEESALVANYFRGFALSGRIRTANARETARLFMAGLTFVRLEHFVIPSTASSSRIARGALDRFLENFLSLIRAPDEKPRKGVANA